MPLTQLIWVTYLSRLVPERRLSDRVGSGVDGDRAGCAAVAHGFGATGGRAADLEVEAPWIVARMQNLDDRDRSLTGLRTAGRGHLIPGQRPGQRCTVRGDLERVRHPAGLEHGRLAPVGRVGRERVFERFRDRLAVRVAIAEVREEAPPPAASTHSSIGVNGALAVAQPFCQID